MYLIVLSISKILIALNIYFNNAILLFEFVLFKNNKISVTFINKIEFRLILIFY